jgi:hypothetical protein
MSLYLTPGRSSRSGHINGSDPCLEQQFDLVRRNAPADFFRHDGNIEVPA